MWSLYRSICDTVALTNGIPTSKKVDLSVGLELIFLPLVQMLQSSVRVDFASACKGRNECAVDVIFQTVLCGCNPHEIYS